MQLHDVSARRLAEVIDAAVSAGKEALSVNRVSVRFGKLMGLWLHSKSCAVPLIAFSVLIMASSLSICCLEGSIS